MDIKSQLRKLIPPCPKCPYRLGQVHAPVNPCPACKLDHYRMFELFQRQLSQQKPE